MTAAAEDGNEAGHGGCAASTPLRMDISQLWTTLPDHRCPRGHLRGGHGRDLPLPSLTTSTFFHLSPPLSLPAIERIGPTGLRFDTGYVALPTFYRNTARTCTAGAPLHTLGGTPRAAPDPRITVAVACSDTYTRRPHGGYRPHDLWTAARHLRR